MMDWKEKLGVVRPGRGLDVGTRFGEFAFRLEEAMPPGSQVIGIDNDPATVEQAREKGKGHAVEFLCMDGAAMTFPDDSFEVVAISNTLHHIEKYNVVLEEMFRVLRPGGLFIVNEMFRDGQNRAQQVHVAQHTFEAKLDMLTGSYQRKTWTRSELLELLEILPLKQVEASDFREEPELDAALAKKNGKLVESVEKKLAGRPEYAELRREAEKIQADCRAYGIQRCTQLLYLGRK